MPHLDGFVMAVPKDNKNAYTAHAKAAMPVFKEHGCIGKSECWADDVAEGEQTDFYPAVQAEEGETIVFARLVWPAQATRDAGMARIIADPRMQPDADPMPFNGKRVITAGIKTLMS